MEDIYSSKAIKKVPSLASWLYTLGTPVHQIDILLYKLFNIRFILLSTIISDSTNQLV